MSRPRFERAYAPLKIHEGGYVNHPDDPGGATNKGVTQRTYDSFRERNGLLKRDVREITGGEVKEIYQRQYWDAISADDLPDGVAYCVFDAAVNSGPGRAVRWLQKCVGAKVDGVAGNETISKTRGADPIALIDEYCDRRLAFMKRLRHWPTFKKGWKRRVAEVRRKAKAWAEMGEDYSPQPTTPVEGKAEGPESIAATIKDAAKDKGAIGAVTGLLGSSGALLSGDGPVQYALAALLVIGGVTAVWWIVRGRK